MSPITSEGEGLTIIGETTFRHYRRRFGLLAPDRLRHLYVLGKTGSGKSTLLQSLIAQDLAHGAGLALLDPHGELIDAVLKGVPPNRENDVLYFAPEDREYPLSFNVFRQGRRTHPNRTLLVSELVTVFKTLWIDSWGPRLEHLLRQALLAVAEHPQATLLLLYRFLTDEAVRERLVASVTDPIVKTFWTKEFPLYGRSLQSEALSPVLNKLGAFIANPVVRNIVGQERSRVDLIDLMNGKGILLAKLSVGAIGADASHLLGALLVSSLQLAAFERRVAAPPFYLYIDEFQRFTTESLATILSESRKYGLALTLSHQYLGQLPESLRQAVLGNVGSLVLFRVGAEDAALLEPEFAPPFTALDLQQLPRYQVAAKLTARGEALLPFSAMTLPPSGAHPACNPASILARSRATYCVPRDQAERLIGIQFQD